MIATKEVTNEILQILAVYPNMDMESVVALIEATNNIKGVSFISLKGYSSLKSEGTEVRDYQFNIGASYENMKAKSLACLKAFDVATLDTSKIKWNGLVLAKGVTPEQFTAEVIAAAPVALAELIVSNTATEDKIAQGLEVKERESNMIYINKMLAFNTTTNRLGIHGQAVASKVVKEGEFKPVKSGAKTVAKQLIQKQAGCPVDMFKRLTLENVNSTIRVRGEEIVINCQGEEIE